MILYARGRRFGNLFFLDYPTRKIEAVGWAYPTILQGAVGTTQFSTTRRPTGLEMQGILTCRRGAGQGAAAHRHAPGGPQAPRLSGLRLVGSGLRLAGATPSSSPIPGSDGFGKTFRRRRIRPVGPPRCRPISPTAWRSWPAGAWSIPSGPARGGELWRLCALAGVTVQHGLYRCAGRWARRRPQRHADLASQSRRRGQRHHALLAPLHGRDRQSRFGAGRLFAAPSW